MAIPTIKLSDSIHETLKKELEGAVYKYDPSSSTLTVMKDGKVILTQQFQSMEAVESISVSGFNLAIEDEGDGIYKMDLSAEVVKQPEPDPDNAYYPQRALQEHPEIVPPTPPQEDFCTSITTVLGTHSFKEGGLLMIDMGAEAGDLFAVISQSEMSPVPKPQSPKATGQLKFNPLSPFVVGSPAYEQAMKVSPAKHKIVIQKKN